MSENISATAADRDTSDSQCSEDETRTVRGQNPPPTLIEWSVRLVSLLSIVGLLWLALQPQVPTRFTFQPKFDKIRSVDSQWAVPVTITNDGSTAISSVTVMG